MKGDLTTTLIIAFLKTYRRLSDKTQMFTYINQTATHYRTRLTHTNEVAIISLEIYNRIVKYLKSYPNIQRYVDILKNINENISEDVILSIALAHDIGHTPFGHQGEETLESLLNSKELLVCGHFKHNFNSFYILLTELFEEYTGNHFEIIKICDGVFKHTNPIPKRIKDLNSKSYIDFYNMGEEIKDLFKSYDESLLTAKINQFNTAFKIKYAAKCDLDLIDKYVKCSFPFFIEGQIVRIADEIAQRISDLDDSIRHLKRIAQKADNILNGLINALKIACYLIYEGTTLDITKFCFDAEHPDFKKYIDLFKNNKNAIVSSQSDADDIDGVKPLSFGLFLINKLTTINDYLSSYAEYNEAINSLSETMMNQGIKFYVQDVVGEFIRECKRISDTKIAEKPYSYDNKTKKYKERVRFSGYGKMLSDVLQEFNYKFIINGAEFQIDDITNANKIGNENIIKCYNSLYSNHFNILQEYEYASLYKALNNRLAALDKVLNIADSAKLVDLRNAINAKKYEAVVEIMKEIYETNKRYKTTNTKPNRIDLEVCKIERLYAFHIAKIIASMNNKYLIDLCIKIEL